MNDMVMQRMRRHDQVANVLRVQRNLHLQRILNGTNRGNRMYRSTDTADALGEQPCLSRVAALQDYLNAAPHLPG